MFEISYYVHVHFFFDFKKCVEWYYLARTWIKEKYEFEADVVCAIKFKSTELGGQVIEGLRHGWYSEKGQR